ncbi:BRCA1-associated ATM activator 1 [Pitangus sulphuratus]|nr:BRCA1-associated ATM activator 1 [Pitangus sulphuratus]
MTRECAALLPGVCAALADPRQPGLDDTCLEKLLDWFRSLTWFDPTVELVQDNPCLTELISSVLALPEPSPSILSFTLQLAGILAASENRFQHLQQEKLLERLFGRDGPRGRAVWEDASVRSAWVRGVHSMVHHQPALHFLCSGGGMDVIFALQGDPSLFVASAASQLLVHILTFSLESEASKALSTKDCLLDESVSDPVTVESLLSSKTSCAGLLCQTLAHLEKLLSLVLKTAFQATSKWLVPLQELSCSNSQCQQTDKILEDVFVVLQKRLCSPCWEVRDSSLEFLTAMIKCMRDQDGFRQCLLSSEVPRLTENLLEDPESYVRASAVTAVGHLAFVTYFAPESPVAGNQFNKENMVAKLHEILSTDSEGFPRRAVISIFTKWLREGCAGQLEDAEQFVSRVIQTVEHDLDWEVRLGGLELVEVFCSQTICQRGLSECPYAPASSAVPSSIPQDQLLRLFCRAKLFGFLFRSLCDCDKPVGQRACDILIGLRGNFYPMSTLENPREIEDSPAGRGIAWLQRTLRQGSLAQNFPTDGGNGVDFQDPESMMVALGAIDLLELHDELNKSSDHVEESPQSLLQDILATMGSVEENEVDCY